MLEDAAVLLRPNAIFDVNGDTPTASSGALTLLGDLWSLFSTPPTRHQDTAQSPASAKALSKETRKRKELAGKLLFYSHVVLSLDSQHAASPAHPLGRISRETERRGLKLRQSIEDDGSGSEDEDEVGRGLILEGDKPLRPDIVPSGARIEEL